MHDQVKTNCPPPPPLIHFPFSLSKANPYSIFIAAVLALALPLVYSTAKAQEQEPSQFKQHQISMMVGGGDLNIDVDAGFGTQPDITYGVSPISLGYGFNDTEGSGFRVQLTGSTALDEVPGLIELSYSSIQFLYRWTFPTAKENIKPYVLAGLSFLTWNFDYDPFLFTPLVEDGSALGFAFGAGVDYFVLPEFSLSISVIADSAIAATHENGDYDAIGTSALFFGASFHF